MAFGCSNCMVDHQTRRQLVQHMHEKHSSPFLEGDNVELSREMLTKKNDAQSAALLRKFDE